MLNGLAHAFILSAAQYWHSARISKDAETQPLELFYPVGHLLGMSAELALKAHLLKCGVTPKTLRLKPLGHNLLTRIIHEGLADMVQTVEMT